MMSRNKKRKKSEDTLYHILFWIIVIAIFPISLSVWFYRTKRFNLSKQGKRIILTIFWSLIALLIVVFGILGPGIKKRNAEKESSKQESIRRPSQETSK